ncbi:MAG: hypothetical protein M1813_006558 [Trichoglossum hirsutum]|nr:MAG: hypothetical protein M1813_006558 [Trichoglossum hirsutum]
MPLLYSEGEKAFIRLQEEIIKHSNDESILAWGLDTEVKQFLEVSHKIELPLVPVYLHEEYPGYDLEEIQSWIGLLNCGIETGSELPGIVLWQGGGDDTAGQVERTEFGSPSKQTVLVSARVAAQAVLTKITIQHSESRIVRDYTYGYRQVIINESLATRNIGYYISKASASNVEQIY